MVRIIEGCRPVSTALPSGGPIDGTRTAGKTVDKPTSSFDRRRHHINRRDKEPSKIFLPLDPNEVPKNPNRGKGLHSDPFSMDRPLYQPRRSKVKVMTPRGPVRSDRRHVKAAPGPLPQKKPGFICANGMQYTSPKRVPKEKHSTTYELAQPPKSFMGNRRFINSPDKVQSVTSPSRSLATSDACALNSPSRVVSNVFPPSALSQSVQPLALSQSGEPHRYGIRINPASHRQGTLEGVWGPLPGGRAPKPSSLAPWMQETVVSHTGRSRALTARAPQAAPYAIEQ